MKNRPVNASSLDHFRSTLVGTTHGSSPLSSFVIATEAWRRGLTVSFTGTGLRYYSISDGNRTIHFDYGRPDSITAAEDHRKLVRKGDTNVLLAAAGVPSPQGKLLKVDTVSMDRLKGIAEKLGYPLVLKPNVGSMGQGVHTNLKDWPELEAAFNQLKREQKPRRAVLEKHHEGEDYRILVVDNQVVGAVQRKPAFVVGDGQTSVSDLLEYRNDTRKSNPFLSHGLVKVDFEVRKVLADQNLALDDAPEAGQHVALRRVANASAGGEVVDVTDELPDHLKQAAVDAVHAIPNIVIAGVDVLYRPADGFGDPGDYVIIELNSRPHLGVNMYPTSGMGRDAAKPIIDTLFVGSRRKETPGIESVFFDATGVRTTIRTGIAETLFLPPMPDHAYPYRKRVVFNSPGEQHKLTNQQKTAIEFMARQGEIAGHLRWTGDHNLELLAAAGEAGPVTKLLRRISRFTGLTAGQREDWDGAITASFVVDL